MFLKDAATVPHSIFVGFIDAILAFAMGTCIAVCNFKKLKTAKQVNQTRLKTFMYFTLKIPKLKKLMD